MTDLEKSIGWEFRDPVLMETALTAPAHRMDHPHGGDNQRLEFLGDAVFGLLCAETLYREFPGEDEGSLTSRRAHLASGAALARAAAKINLAAMLRINKGGTRPAPQSKAAADAMEAVLGAVWLDGGIEAARAVFARLWPHPEEQTDDFLADNPKGRLQCLAQAMTPQRTPEYSVESVSGPPHAPVWRCEVSVRDIGSATGEGRSRRAAESAAATALLAQLENRKI